MNFILLPREHRPPDTGTNTVYLKIDHWNDYSFVTMFYMSLHDENGAFHEIGNVKIGFAGQDESAYTFSTLESPFTHLLENYFSLGMDVSYYENIINNLSPNFRNELLGSLRDMINQSDLFDKFSKERVVKISLLRNVSLSAVRGQFRRVLDGGSVLTDYVFGFKRPQENRYAGVSLDFQVEAESTPRTNIHAIIGRNGVGKTSLLNEMTKAITNMEGALGRFTNKELFQEVEIGEDYFSSLVSVAFSAFDPFTPPSEQHDPSLGTCYYYIGLKKTNGEENAGLKNMEELHAEFSSNLGVCFSQSAKKQRWLDAISTLESDDNFAEMGLPQLADIADEQLRSRTSQLVKKMSTGHASVLLTLTKLVARVEEKTLVIIDEPETHLHPPLLSAFVRTLSELLFSRNGVAIIATHSPVVLQEVPRSCVWKLTRARLSLSSSRPEVETFGENVGVLTREVFGLEVSKSGFHELLGKAVDNGSSYEDVLEAYDGQLGLEARGVVRALIANRERERGP